MATSSSSRISNNRNLSSSIDERRQVQARIRALQQRTNALHEELSRSSVVTKSTVLDIERTYMKITNEFRDQRDELLRRLHNVNQNIKQSTNELDSVRRNLDTARSYRISHMSPRYSTDNEVYEMNAMVNDIEQVLNKIAQQLKQVQFVPSKGRSVDKSLGRIRVQNPQSTEKDRGSVEISIYEDNSTSNLDLAVHKLYTIDLDISGQWVVASFDKRIFICDNEGQVRIYSYFRHQRRQPLIIERFHLSTLRLISCFTVTQDYLIAFENDTQILTLYSHHGALLLRLYSPSNPTMFVRCDYKKKNHIWTCNRAKRQCYQLYLNHTAKEITLVDRIDFTVPIGDVLTDPFDISVDEQNRIAIHDVNPTTIDRLILFSNEQNTTHSLDYIYDSKPFSSRIERVLLVPKHPHLIIVIYTTQSSGGILYEIVVVNIHSQPAEILHHFSEVNKIQNVDLTLNSELVYTVAIPVNKRIPSKMHIYSLIE